MKNKKKEEQSFEIQKKKLEHIQGGGIIVVTCPNCAGRDWQAVKDQENIYKCTTCGEKHKIEGGVLIE